MLQRKLPEDSAHVAESRFVLANGLAAAGEQAQALELWTTSYPVLEFNYGEDALGNLVGPSLAYKQLDTIIAVARTGLLPERLSGLMPTYNGQLDEGTLQAISDYLMSLDQR